MLLEYLVTHGSERVVDEARGHISTIKVLRSFQYVDENGKDEGLNGTLTSSYFVSMWRSSLEMDNTQQEEQENEALWRSCVEMTQRLQEERENGIQLRRSCIQMDLTQQTENGTQLKSDRV